MQILDNGFVELQNMMGCDLSVVNAARTSFLGESKGEEADKKLLFYLMQHGHTSPFEMIEFKFLVRCPIFVARQWMRHRTWSFNEVSRRYTSQNIDFYYPRSWRLQSVNNKQGSAEDTLEEISECYDSALRKICVEATKIYEQAIADGVALEMARMFLPPNLYTTFVGKTDAHNLMRFLRVRMDEHAQYEIRQYANAIYQHYFKPNLPWTAEAFERFVLNGA